MRWRGRRILSGAVMVTVWTVCAAMALLGTAIHAIRFRLRRAGKRRWGPWIARDEAPSMPKAHVHSLAATRGGPVILESGVGAAASKYNLSPRERQVLELGCAGLSSKEIAARLDCSPRTVEVYWSRAFSKMGVRTRAAVLSVVIRLAQ
jgi:DNA-binding CsgD family transcriptional regulator